MSHEEYKKAFAETEAFLDTIDLKDILQKSVKKNLDDIMDDIQDCYSENVADSELLQGEVWNAFDEDDLVRYLKKRYGSDVQIFEHTHHTVRFIN